MRLIWVGFPVLERLMPKSDPIDTFCMPRSISIRLPLPSLRASGYPTTASVAWIGIPIQKIADGPCAAFKRGKFSDITKKEADTVKIGYIRVSTLEQNTIRQEVMMRELGIAQAMNRLGMSKPTFYRKVRQWEGVK